MRAGRSVAIDRSVALALITFSLGLMLLYLWWGRFEYSKGLFLTLTYLGVGGSVVVSHWYFRDSRKELGLRADNLGIAFKSSLLPHCILFVSIGVLHLAIGLSPAWSELSLVYLPWAFLQQYLLQNLVFARIKTVFGQQGLSILLTAVVFALIHLPNLWLVALSFVGGLLWCWMFQRHPNLLTVTLSHSVLGILLAVLFKFAVLDQFQVGQTGFAYTTFGDGVAVAAGYDGDNLPVVVTLPGQDLDNPSQIRVFRPDGTQLREWIAFEDFGFSGFLAMGDLGFGPGDEIVVAPGPGTRNPAIVVTFSIEGEELSRFELSQFPGYGAFVDVYQGRILVSPGPGPDRRAQILEYEPSGQMIRQWDLGNLEFHNSVKVSRVPPSTESIDSLDRFLLFGHHLSVNSSRIQVFDTGGNFLGSWRTMGSAFGLNLSPFRLGAESFGIAAAPGAAPGHTPHIVLLDSEGNELRQFFPYESQSPCGANLAAIDIDGDLVDELVLGEGGCPGQNPTVRIVDLDGRVLYEWNAY